MSWGKYYYYCHYCPQFPIYLFLYFCVPCSNPMSSALPRLPQPTTEINTWENTKMYNKRLYIYPVNLFKLFGDDRKAKARPLNYTWDWSLEMSITTSVHFLDYDLQPGNCRVIYNNVIYGSELFPKSIWNIDFHVRLSGVKINSLISFFSAVERILMQGKSVVSVEMRQVIRTLCGLLKAAGLEAVPPPETFRRAKFGGGADVVSYFIIFLISRLLNIAFWDTAIKVNITDYSELCVVVLNTDVMEIIIMVFVSRKPSCCSFSWKSC